LASSLTGTCGRNIPLDLALERAGLCVRGMQTRLLVRQDAATMNWRDGRLVTLLQSHCCRREVTQCQSSILEGFGFSWEEETWRCVEYIRPEKTTELCYTHYQYQCYAAGRPAGRPIIACQEQEEATLVISIWRFQGCSHVLSRPI
jgi:hypothetical protein